MSEADEVAPAKGSSPRGGAVSKINQLRARSSDAIARTFTFYIMFRFLIYTKGIGRQISPF